MEDWTTEKKVILSVHDLPMRIHIRAAEKGGGEEDGCNKRKYEPRLAKQLDFERPREI